mmetsp:Transcript_1246/g.3846  ORF Transcript_1246/g.3846 Transcript_1246/m.3846 type:complete len:308 (+) Transcript_1246:1093-2016(+)
MARPEVNVRRGPDLLVDPLEAVGPAEARQLEQVHEGGPHVAPEGGLAPLLRLAVHREDRDARVARGLRQGDADLAHARGLERVRVPDKGLRELLQLLLHPLVGVVEAGAVRELWESIPADDEVHHAQGHLAATCRQRRQCLLREHGVELLEAWEEHEDAVAVASLALARGEPLRPGGREQFVLLHHVELLDVRGRGEPVQVGRDGLLLQLGIGFAQEFHHQLQVQPSIGQCPGRQSVAGGQRLLVCLRNFLAQARRPLLVGLVRYHVEQLLSQVPHAAVVPGRTFGARHFGELLHPGTDSHVHFLIR